MPGGLRAVITGAPYAAREDASRGRIHPEARPRYRSEFQRDRDRVIHCSAFRRLEYKTQVFVNHEGDMFRTRLTHSLEVAQISRTVARALGLDEDLTEAVALAHDLGHTPFGHAGQDALNDCMRGFGGFEHNLQSLRVVDLLEERYPDFPGLNLCFETREGILKHCSRANARTLGPVAERFLSGRQPTLEAQLANLADEVAYNHHDIDDGLRAGLLAIGELHELECFRTPWQEVRGRWPGLDEGRTVHAVIRRMIDRQVTDLVETSRAAIEAAAPEGPDGVRAAGGPLVAFGEESRAAHRELKVFLRERLYRHHQVHRMAVKARRVVRALFECYFDDSRLLPPAPRARVSALSSESGEAGRARAVADYVAGMTDRFAIAEHARLTSFSGHF